MAKKLSTMALGLIDDLMGDMSKKKKKRLGAAIGLLAGAIANEKYNSLSDSEKQTWNHAEVGGQLHLSNSPCPPNHAKKERSESASLR